MRAKDIRNMDDAAIAKELRDLLREQFNLRMQRATGQLGNTARFSEVRRDIARVRTVMTEKRDKSDSA
ncbi:MAG: 50S ribosomal protein L29 [Acidiferrobacterales bacterium]